jgi:hypothetical protein
MRSSIVYRVCWSWCPLSCIVCLIRLLPEHDTTVRPLPGSLVVAAAPREHDAGLEEKLSTVTTNGDEEQDDEEQENAQGFLFNPQRKQSVQSAQVCHHILRVFN